MSFWPHLVLPATTLVLSAAGGLLYAMLTDRLASRSLAAVENGKAITVPMLVAVNGEQRRGRAVLDGDLLRVIGKGLHLTVTRDAFRTAGVRRGQLDVERLEYAQQRGFTDAAGTRYLLGPVEEWETALAASLESPAGPAHRGRLFLAALPRQVLLPMALAVLGLFAFQALWLTGHDVQAAMVRVVGDEGYESCGVKWEDAGRAEYAEVDCYAPFPAVGSPVTVRALSWPFDESAMDYEGTYPIVSALFGGPALALAFAAAAVARSRMRRTPVLLAPIAAPLVAHVAGRPDRMTVVVEPDAPLSELLDAAAAREGWADDVAAVPPTQPRFARPLMALGAGTWWPAAVLGGVALLIDVLPVSVRVALAAGAAAVLLWAMFRAVIAWLAIRRAYEGPVTSEWDYRLVRSVEDEWWALLFLGQTPHWVVVLDGPGHPPPLGRCGVRGDLEEGGAIQLQIEAAFWPTLSPVGRVDEETLGDLRDDLLDRLGSPI
jgi:hypothetical protein